MKIQISLSTLSPEGLSFSLLSLQPFEFIMPVNLACQYTAVGVLCITLDLLLNPSFQLLYKCHVIYASLFSVLYLNVGEHSKWDCP